MGCINAFSRPFSGCACIVPSALPPINIFANRNSAAIIRLRAWGGGGVVCRSSCSERYRDDMKFLDYSDQSVGG